VKDIFFDITSSLIKIIQQRHASTHTDVLVHNVLELNELQKRDAFGNIFCAFGCFAFWTFLSDHSTDFDSQPIYSLMALISPVDGSKNIHFSHYSQLPVTNSFLDHFYHNSAQKTSRVCTLVKNHSILKLINKQEHLYHYSMGHSCVYQRSNCEILLMLPGRCTLCSLYPN